MTYPKSILYLILALALIRGIIYASVVPPWQAPDEPPQFERAKAALTTSDWLSNSKNPAEWYGDLAKSLFVFDHFDFLDTPRLTYSSDKPINRYIALYQEMYEDLYASRGAYAMTGWLLWLNKSNDIIFQLYLVRLNTILMNIGIIFLAYLITKTIFPKHPFLFLGVPIIILFMPQHTHLLSTVNNGNLAELLAAAVIYFVVRLLMRGFSWLNILYVLIFSLAAMWTKATAYFFIFTLGVVGLFYLWQYRRHWRWLLPAGLITMGVTYFFIPERLKLLIFNAWTKLQTMGFNLDPIVPKDLFRSFWAMPGWTIFQLHPIWYQILAIGCILSIIGLVILVVSKRHQYKQYQRQIQTLTVLAITVIMAISILLAWNGLDHIIIYRQGRSIYPVIIPIAIFLLLGWRQLIPEAWQKIGLLAITLLFFLFDSMVLFHYLIPFFYSRY